MESIFVPYSVVFPLSYFLRHQPVLARLANWEAITSVSYSSVFFIVMQSLSCLCYSVCIRKTKIKLFYSLSAIWLLFNKLAGHTKGLCLFIPLFFGFLSSVKLYPGIWSSCHFCRCKIWGIFSNAIVCTVWLSTTSKVFILDCLKFLVTISSTVLVIHC